MQTNSIFSTYSTGENRVTASIMAVLRSLSLNRLEKILGALMERPEFELASFSNQPSKGGEGVPDALIHASAYLLIETKIERNAVNTQQIQRHLKRLGERKEETKALLVLTPDTQNASKNKHFDNPSIVWATFTNLDQAIDYLLDDKYEVTSERERYLLRELQNMLVAERLIASEDDTVVVAARSAWPEYKELAAYVCQPNRTFQPVTRMAFYSKGAIHHLVPKILEVHDEVPMILGHSKGALGELVDRLVREQRRSEGETYKVFLLSSPDSPETFDLNREIQNDAKSASGKPTAFTMGQRYVDFEKLVKAKTTSDLITSPSVD